MNTHIKKITGVSSNTERAEATVVPFSPVFIGSGDKYYKGIDFFCHGGQTCLFDHQKIFKEFLNDLDNLEQALGKKDLAAFLKARGKNLQNYVKLQWNGEVKGRDLAAPLTDGFGHPLLPGSSLKGSIRTALFADFFRRRKISAVQYEKLISRGKVGDKRLNSRLLTTWSGGQKKTGSEPNYDLGRALRVGDATFSPSDTEIFNTIIANETNMGFRWKKFKQRPHQKERSLETATQTSLAALSFDSNTISPVPVGLSIDLSALKHIGWKEPFTFKTIAYACNRLSKKLIELELDYLKEAERNLPELDTVIAEYTYLLEDVKASISELKTTDKITWFQRVGWGSGWLSMTGAHAYARDDSEIDYIDILRKKASFLFKRTGNLEYPKTRKVVLDQDGKPAMGMGWVYIEINDIN